MGAGAFGERDDWLRLNTATTCTPSLPMGSLPATSPLAANPGLKDGLAFFPPQFCPAPPRSPARSSPAHLRSTPPSRDALRHSGGDRRLCTSATVTLYLEVELSRDRRPGTEQKTSLGFTTPPKSASLLMGMEEMALALDLERDTGPAEGEGEREKRGEGRPREGRAALVHKR